jgi:pimeloyl-ACP methyl ester carboxylesterase
MRIYSMPRRATKWAVLLLSLYGAFNIAAGIAIAELALHPWRRPLPQNAIAAVKQLADRMDSRLVDAQIVAGDGNVLRAWAIQPNHGNGHAVILLHGVSDNRFSMIGYAELLLWHGYAVVLPDSRAHGLSDGPIATYGVFERNDVHLWVDWIADNWHPQCIYGLGESMGAAQLLQALAAEPRFCAIAVEDSFASLREISYDRMGQVFHLGPWMGRVVLRPAVELAFFYTRRKYGWDPEQASPLQVIGASHAPILLIHGLEDHNIPIRHAYQLHERQPKSALWPVPNAEHCGALAAAPQEFEKRMIGWFAEHTAAVL